MATPNTSPPAQDDRTVFFFDIDNCLYSKNNNVHGLMGELIDKYFQSHLSLTPSEANMLHNRYYRDYGLAIEGLVRHHKVNALEYNRLVDDALPLDEVLSPDPELKTLLDDLDRSKVKPWLLTNAYITHAKRVVKILGVEACFEGITFCDYAVAPFLCKPATAMWEKAEREAGVKEGDRASQRVYFVDDSYLNAGKAREYGWSSVHFHEKGDDDGEELELTSRHRIGSLYELRELFPRFFKSTNSTG